LQLRGGVGGSSHARDGIRRLLCTFGPEADWRQVTERYRQLLYVSGEQRGLDADGRPLRPGFSPEQVEKVLEAGGALPLDQLLRCRVRYFTDGSFSAPGRSSTRRLLVIAAVSAPSVRPAPGP